MAFPLKLCMPAWCKAAAVRVNGKLMAVEPVGGFSTIGRAWTRVDRIEIKFANETRTVSRYDGYISVEHGPPLFAPPIGERWSKIRDCGLPADYEVFPTTPGNHGMAEGVTPRRIERAAASVTFSRRSPPVAVTVSTRLVSRWTATDGRAVPSPREPLEAGASQLRIVMLIPYGSAKLRITSFPSVQA